jgi:outer membrane protein assembly factor BamB
MRSLRQTISTLAAFGIAILCWGNALHAENNWANWRGPNFDGSLEGANPPLEWSDTKNIQWKVPVPGRGIGSPVVWGDQILLLTAIDTGQPAEGAAAPSPDAGAGGGNRGAKEAPQTVHEFIVISFSLATGDELWRTTVNRAVPHEGGHHTNTFASASAVTDGERIFASFGSHGIYGLDMQGKKLWEKDLGDMQTRNHFGEGSSPALVGDTLIVPWDQEENSCIYALDAKTGDVRWRADRDEVTTWATPLAVEHDGRTQIVTNGTMVRSYDLATGDLLWSCGGQVTNPIPSPVRLDDFVVCMTGYRGNAIYAMPLDAKGDITDTEQIRWRNLDAAPYVSSPVLYKGQLYFTKERSGAMSSIDARTGEVLIPPTRLSEILDVYASPVAAADRIYFTSRDGVTTVIRHSKTLEELAVNKLGESVDASPAIIGDSLLIRGAEHLYRISE